MEHEVCGTSHDAERERLIESNATRHEILRWKDLLVLGLASKIPTNMTSSIVL